MQRARHKKNMSIVAMCRQVGLSRAAFYLMETQNRPVASLPVLINCYQFCGFDVAIVSEHDDKPHRLKINDEYVRPTHFRLLHSPEAAHMINELFQQNPSNKTIADLAIAFECSQRFIVNSIVEAVLDTPAIRKLA